MVEFDPKAVSGQVKTTHKNRLDTHLIVDNRLEVRILKKEAQRYPVELDLNGQQQFERGYLAAEILPWTAGASPRAEGERLFQALTQSTTIQQAWAKIQGQTQNRFQLHLRLDPDTPALHSLPWELLYEETYFAADADTPFSRYLPGETPLPPPPSLDRPIKMLVAIAGPDDLDAYNLDPVDAEAEWGVLQAAFETLGDFERKSSSEFSLHSSEFSLNITHLPDPCTLANLETALRQGYHILHFIGHGRLSRRNQIPALYLANAENKTAPVEAGNLVQMLKRLEQDQLRLLFLASCQTAAAETRGAEQALGGLAPGLIRAGIPAVLAMQSKLAVATARDFSRTFYQELFRHGQIDLAANQARSTLLSGETPGSNIPILFSRLPDNRLFVQNLTALLPAAAPEDQHNLTLLVNKVKSFWIEGVLERSIHTQVLLDLGKTPDQTAIEHPWAGVLEIPDQADQAIPPARSIARIFASLDRAMLILGAPGSGKTITLLELARDLLQDVEQDPRFTQPVPVVFNLASWRPDQTLKTWLVDELSLRYQIPKRLGRPWIENDRLVLLLDGLDEVSQVDQAACVDAINAFKAEFGLTGLAVCSRSEEYDSLPVKLALIGAIRLQPLTPAQIETYLAMTGSNLSPLKQALSQDETLQTLAQSPLILSIMHLAYQEEPIMDEQDFETIDEHRQHLFDTYIERMFKRKGDEQTPYTDQQTINWLVWLAQGMQGHNQSIFLIERLQPSWLRTLRERWIYFTGSRLLQGLALGLLCGLILGLINEMYFSFFTNRPGLLSGLQLELQQDLFSQLLKGVGLGAVWGIVLGLALGLIDWLRFEPTSSPAPEDRPKQPGSSGNLGRATGFGFLAALMGGLIRLPDFWISSALLFGLAYGLIFGLRGRRQSMSNDIQTVEVLRLSWFGLAKGFGLGLLAGAIFGVLFGLLVGVLGMWLYDQIFSFGLAWGLFYGLSIGLAVGLGGALYGGLKTSILETPARPNQGIRLSLKNGALTSLLMAPLSAGLFGLVYSLSFGPFIGLRVGLVAGLSLGLLALLWFGGFDIIQHYLLRLILVRKRYTPPDYAAFLDYAVDRIFLQKVGGGYIFVHRTLAEHFASFGADLPNRDALAEPGLAAGQRRFRNISLAYLIGLILLVFSGALWAGFRFHRQITIDNKLNQAATEARAGHIETALDQYEGLVQELGGPEAIPAGAWNTFCWYGSLAGEAETVMNACEAAVAQAPDNGAYRDSRGLARALTGDFEGAITDFDYYVDWSKMNGQYDQYGFKREAWIAALQAGQNPFDQAALEMLREE